MEPRIKKYVNKQKKYNVRKFVHKNEFVMHQIDLEKNFKMMYNWKKQI